MKDPAFKDATGNFSPAAFQQALQSIGMTEQGYLASLRERNLRRQILTTVGEVVNSPEMLIDALNSFNGETRTLRYVLVPASVAGTIPDPTEEDLKGYYDNHQSKFTQPEYRKIGVLAVTPETVKDQVADHRGRRQGRLRGEQRSARQSRAQNTSSKSPSPISPPPTPPIRRFSPAPISWRSPRSRA